MLATTVGPPPALRSSRTVLLTTYRRDGTAVPTPIWLVEHRGVLWGTSAADAGKVRRLRHTERVLVAPCTWRGSPLGASIPAVARIHDANAVPWLAAAFYRRYPVLARLFQTINRLQGQRQVAIEFVF